MKKTYVLDTNVLLNDPNSIYSFEEHDVIVPMAVLEELDKHKSRQDMVGQNARKISRMLDELREFGRLDKGVKLNSGGTLSICHIDQSALKLLPPELQIPKVDNMIIAFMLYLDSMQSVQEKLNILVSKDINVRVKCDSLGIECQDYLKMRVNVDKSEFYRGVATLNLDEVHIDEFYRNKKIDLNEIKDQVDQPLYPNQIIVMKNVQEGVTVKSAIGKLSVSDDSATSNVVLLSKIEQAFGLMPKNKEQSFALDLLFDNNIKLVTLSGPSGCGKTSLALAAALEQLRTLGHPNKAVYDKIIVSKPVLSVGKDIGFLPGTLEEKMQPWIAPIKDNLNFLMGIRNKNSRNRSEEKKSSVSDDHYLAVMQERGLIEIEAISFIRGRSIPNSFIIIDEAQNLNMHEIKTIITRAGEGTKIVLTGDIDQIDNVHVDVYTNGLTYAIEKFKDYNIAGHVTMVKGERSALATLASKIL